MSKPMTAKQAAKTMTKAFNLMEEAHNLAMRVVRERYPDGERIVGDLAGAHRVYRMMLAEVEQDAEEVTDHGAD